MNFYHYAIRYTFKDGRVSVVQGSVSCRNFHSAVRMVENDDECSQEHKQAVLKQILYISMVP